MPPELFSSVGSQSSFIRDVQKMTISELIELYAYAEAIVETVREPLIILDHNFQVKSVNKGFRKTFRVRVDETVGHNFFELGNGQWDIPQLRRLLRDILPKDRVFENYEVRHVFPNIGKKIMILNARTVVLAEYRTALILVAIEDITEKKMIEERTEKFISMASHELRTPLTSIKGFMQLLEQRLNKGVDKPTSYIMSRVIQQLNFLNDMIRDLFDMRKIREGKLVVRRRRINAGPVIKEAVEAFRFITPHRTILFENHTGGKVNADRERIMQVMTNLLTNAVKYSPDKTPIAVSFSVNKKDVIVSVRDNGAGISKADQKNLFNPYFSADLKKERVGLGLGLYICAEIIKRHEGKLWVESSPGKGSTFFFSLPLA